MFSNPNSGDKFYGQDATYKGNQASYTDNNNGTISDNITGLMWAKDFSKKLSFNQALSYAKESNLGGYSDWRIPTI